MFKDYQPKKGYDEYFSSDDFLQALKRSRYINQFSKDRKRVANKISNSIKLLDKKIVTLNSLKSDKNNLLKQNQENQINLETEELSITRSGVVIQRCRVISLR